MDWNRRHQSYGDNNKYRSQYVARDRNFGGGIKYPRDVRRSYSPERKREAGGRRRSRSRSAERRRSRSRSAERRRSKSRSAERRRSRSRSAERRRSKSRSAERQKRPSGRLVSPFSKRTREGVSRNRSRSPGHREGKRETKDCTGSKKGSISGRQSPSPKTKRRRSPISSNGTATIVAIKRKRSKSRSRSPMPVSPDSSKCRRSKSPKSHSKSLGKKVEGSLEKDASSERGVSNKPAEISSTAKEKITPSTPAANPLPSPKSSPVKLSSESSSASSSEEESKKKRKSSKKRKEPRRSRIKDKKAKKSKKKKKNKVRDLKGKKTDTGDVRIKGGTSNSPTKSTASTSKKIMETSVKEPEKVEPKKALRPMTKEEWETKQSRIRREVSPTSGRTRLIKGDGEILEEIVSKKRHREINKMATEGDGKHFQCLLNKTRR